MFYYMYNNTNYHGWNKALTFGVGSIQLSFRTIVFAQYMQRCFQSKCYCISVELCRGFALYCFSLTLGAHARGLQYLFCLCVCLCVYFPYSGTLRNQAYKQQYQRLQRDTGMKYKKGFFFKTLRSEVMALFTHLE